MKPTTSGGIALRECGKDSGLCWRTDLAFGYTSKKESRRFWLFGLRRAAHDWQKQPRTQGRVSTADGRIQGFVAPISMLATQLSIATGLIVEDETDLRGSYDFVLDWAPDEKDQERDARPSIFSAVGEQMGLRLERAKGSVKTVVIDQVEHASAN